MSDRSFIHSGDYGDLIYALPTIKALGGGNLILNPNLPKHAQHRMKISNLLELLTMQDYIGNVYWDVDNPNTCPLNEFRTAMRGRVRNIAEVCLDMYPETAGHYDCLTAPWITVDDPIREKQVVFNRSLRYHGSDALWRKLRQNYPQAIFLGTEEEHLDFRTKFGPIEWIPTGTLFEAARWIAGAKLFCGNQSALAAIAEGVKVKMILEVCDKCPNCLFERFDRINAWNERILL